MPDSPDGSRDVAHFRGALRAERARLGALVETWEPRAARAGGGDGALAEEAAGRVLSAVGKARLLMGDKGRFRQFEGLVDACERGLGPKPTTCRDLGGFWDMIYFQVEDVVQMFEELERLEAGGWRRKEEEEDAKENAKRPVAKPARKKVSATQQRRRCNLGLKKMMAEGRRELKEDKARERVDGAAEGASRPSLLEARTPGSVLRPVNKSVEKVFEGGFFAVRSPVRGGMGDGGRNALSASPAAFASNRSGKAVLTSVTVAALNFDQEA